mgnify:CR=1 FL=1
MAETIDIRELNERIERQSSFVTNLTAGMDQIIVGQKHLVESLLIGLLSDGHVLLEGVPGLAKTLAIKTLASLIDAQYSRVQFTPDLLPADVIGTMVYSQKDETFQVKKGPVFANFVLADEINRTSSRTQSALLEVMEEGQVTVDGVTRNIPEPFFVIATQNPLGSAGTQMLPESQMDRFMVLLSMGYPTIKEEMILMSQRKVSDPLDDVNEVISKEELLSMQKEVNEIKVSSLIYQYIAMLSDATRRHDMIQLGVSPRGSLALCRMAKASAFLAGRDYVVPEDVQDVVKDVFRHRLVLKSRARLSSKDADKIMDEICATVHVPDRRAAGGRR